MKYRLENMTCGGCARSVVAAIKAGDQLAVVTPDVEARTVAIETTQSAEDVERALASAGFPVTAAPGSALEGAQR